MQLNLDQIKVYDDTSLANILKRIDNNSEQKSERISELTDMLSGMIDNLDDAVVLVPLVKEYLEVDIKNDKQMIELAKIVQRLLTGYMRNSENIDTTGIGDQMNDSDRSALQKMAQQMRDRGKKAADSIDEDPEVKEFEEKANNALKELNKDGI